ncbi:SIR2 domain containing protein [Trichuris trichiura]|uniref:SIR2 domain containing protein n=1 Tax=Trichuris trichiura TaxID=36087 RepID=A0A077ZAD6_TRITR|nr:SIR2 domain containing protein [Trichuris trichiura]
MFLIHLQAAMAGQLAMAGKCPMEIIERLLGKKTVFTGAVDHTRMAWKALQEFLQMPPPRTPLFNGAGLPEVAQLIMRSKRIVVVAGAGVSISVSCGVPDFRGISGFYKMLKKKYPLLDYPEQVFNLDFFDVHPELFYKVAKELYPAGLRPSLTHQFFALLEKRNKLLRMYTQNVDTLEEKAGINNVVYCHGSFATATCRTCGVQVEGAKIERKILAQKVPHCKRLSVMKPDITFFGESLPAEFFHYISVDMERLDLLLVVGTSLKVNPVSLIPDSVPLNVPRVLINCDKVEQTFDIDIICHCDDAVSQLMEMMGEKL